MRRIYIVGIAAGILLFLVISALLARVLSANGAEQSAITTLIRDEARGDADAMLGDIAGCRADPVCRQRVAENAAALKHPGSISILTLQPSTTFSVGGTLGTARVAWNVGGSLPIVQCVRVRRTGNAVSGLHVELVAVTPRIQSDADCPTRF
jgi:hypothetical protein